MISRAGICTSHRISTVYYMYGAAESGKSGDPNDYRDFEIAPPANRLLRCDVPWRLLSYTPERVHVETLANGPAHLEFAQGSLASLTGRIREVEASYREGQLLDLHVECEGSYEVKQRTSGVGRLVDCLPTG